MSSAEIHFVLQANKWRVGDIFVKAFQDIFRYPFPSSVPDVVLFLHLSLVVFVEDICM